MIIRVRLVDLSALYVLENHLCCCSDVIFFNNCPKYLLTLLIYDEQLWFSFVRITTTKTRLRCRLNFESRR